MLRHRRLLALVFASSAASALSASALAQQSPSTRRVYDLAAFTRTAERNYPSLRASQHSIAAARARLDEAWVSPFFQLNVTAAFTFAPEQRGTAIVTPDDVHQGDWVPGARVGVEGAVPLWTFGKLGAARDAARAGVRAAEEDRERALLQLRVDVRRAYYALQLALDTAQMFSEGYGRFQRAVQRVQQRIAAGDPNVNEMDGWRLSSTVAEIDARRSEAQRLESSSRAALRILSGVRSFEVPDCPMEAVDIELKPLAWYVRAARIHRPEASMLEAGVAARAANVTATRARYFPDLALGLSATYAYGPGLVEQSDPFRIERENYVIGGALVARWSLDLWGNAYRVERAEHELYELRARADEANRGIALEVESVYYEVLDARTREEAWGRGHRDGRAWFLAAAQAYDLGTVESRDLVDAVRTYFTARFNHLTAIRDYNTAVARLERAVGVELAPVTAWEHPCPEPESE